MIDNVRKTWTWEHNVWKTLICLDQVTLSSMDTIIQDYKFSSCGGKNHIGYLSFVAETGWK
jgi:hypothetical protein